MRRSAIAFILLLPLLCVASAAQTTSEEPADVDRTEEVEVNLVLIETLVLDHQGRTVPDLTRDDFRLSVQGKAVEIDTFDANCPVGAVDDPKGIDWDQKREPIAPELKRRIVLVLDYYHLGRIDRQDVLTQAKGMVVRDKTPGDEIMIAALADGLRIEQRFTSNRQKLLRTLDRMEYDVTLYARDFQPTTERSFFDNLATLADVLAEYDGPKAVVMFSTMASQRDEWDTWYGDLAQHAAAGRVVIYPVWAPGLQAGGPAGGSGALARIANESGGRFTRLTSDLSLGYARAQRDLACRYTLGYYADPGQSRRARSVRVRLNRSGYEVRAPEMIRMWSEEERMTSRIRAAFADPQKHEEPLLRAHVFPIRPVDTKSWEVLVALSFPLELGPDGAQREIGVSLNRGNLNMRSLTRQLSFDPPKSGQTGSLPVTLYGNTTIKPGDYSLTAVLTSPGDERIRTANVQFPVPAVPRGVYVLRGPVLARVTPDGLRMRAGKKTGRYEFVVDDLIGPDAGFEPLLVHQIDSTDDLLALWEICSVDAPAPSTGATIRRRVIGAEDEEVYTLEPIPLGVDGKGKVRCQGNVDSIPGGTLPEGQYRLEVTVEIGADADLLARGVAPLAVR